MTKLSQFHRCTNDERNMDETTQEMSEKRRRLVTALFFSPHCERRKKKKRKKMGYIPSNEEGFIQAVEDTDYQIVICNRLDLWPWKLPIYQNPLHFDSFSTIFILKSSSRRKQMKIDKSIKIRRKYS